MDDPRKTILEGIQRFAYQYPELAPRIEQIAIRAQNKKPFDSIFLQAINHNLLSKSKSQLRQDIFVLHELGFKQDGFFVEFGATNGIDLSNTYLLETEYNWNGILAEPAKIWHDALTRNRRAKVDKRCVWKASNETILFNETNVAELSTIDQLSESDMHASERGGGKKYSVNTITLMDLLEEHGAPREIDYLSIDTEGSEYDILENFDFKKYQFKIITCEHNYSLSRDKLHTLFQRNGFQRKYENITKFDDWYVRI